MSRTRKTAQDVCLCLYRHVNVSLTYASIRLSRMAKGANCINNNTIKQARKAMQTKSISGLYEELESGYIALIRIHRAIANHSWMHDATIHNLQAQKLEREMKRLSSVLDNRIAAAREVA